MVREDIYLNCGIWEPEDMLFIAVPGYFASTAWCESDEAYNNISGRKFEAITADDGESYQLGRDNIRRLNEDDNIEKYIGKSCEKFKKIFNNRFGNE